VFTTTPIEFCTDLAYASAPRRAPIGT